MTFISRLNGVKAMLRYAVAAVYITYGTNCLETTTFPIQNSSTEIYTHTRWEHQKAQTPLANNTGTEWVTSAQGAAVQESVTSPTALQERAVGTRRQQLPPPPKAAQQCPSGFLKHRGSCYHLQAPAAELTNQLGNSIGQRNYSAARLYCASLGSHLVSIESESEQLFVERVLAKTGGKAFWTSGRPVVGEGKWQWESTGRELSYVNWLADYSSWPYEAAHDVSNCLIIDATSDYQWMFWPCDHSYYVVGAKRSTRVPIGLVCKLSNRQAGTSSRRKAKAKYKSDMT